MTKKYRPVTKIRSYGPRPEVKTHYDTLWPGHVLVTIEVKRWHWVYRWFNLVFARASRRTEYLISEKYPVW